MLLEKFSLTSTRKRNFFFVFKKIASTWSAFESFLLVDTNTLYRFENAKKPVWAVDELILTASILKEVVQAV